MRSWSDIENSTLTVNQSVSFDHFGRKLIWAEVNGQKVGDVGVSLRPKIQRK